MVGRSQAKAVWMGLRPFLASLPTELSVCSGKILSPSSLCYPEIADTPGPVGLQPGAWPRDRLTRCWPSQQCLQKYTMFQAWNSTNDSRFLQAATGAA